MAYEIRFSPEAVKNLNSLEFHFSKNVPTYVAANYVNSIVDCCEFLKTSAQRGFKCEKVRRNLRIIELKRRFTATRQQSGFTLHFTVAFEDKNHVTNILGIFYDEQNSKMHPKVLRKSSDVTTKPI